MTSETLCVIRFNPPHSWNDQRDSTRNDCHYILDWNYDAGRRRTRTGGDGRENITRPLNGSKPQTAESTIDSLICARVAHLANERL